MILSANNSVPVYGLVLAGGRSKRMGIDKSVMRWHGKEQRYYMADLLAGICSHVFISCRAEQQSEINGEYETLPDAYNVPGPYGAILSAFKSYPEAAWLVVACDLPLLDTATLQYLVNNRDTTKIATTYQSPFDSLPEPLITIWEPAAYNRLLAFSAEGLSCPRKALIRNGDDVKMLIPPYPDALMNANTPEDAEKVNDILLR